MTIEQTSAVSLLFVLMGIDFSSLNKSVSTFSDGDGSDGPKYTINSQYHIGLVIGGTNLSGKSTLFRYLHKGGYAEEVKETNPIVVDRVLWTNPFTEEKALVDLSKVDFGLIKYLDQSSNKDLEETYGDASDVAADKEKNITPYVEKLENLYKNCTCFIFVADPRKDSLFSDFEEQIQNLPLNTTIVVVCNFVDMKSEWKLSLEDIRRRCEKIAARSPKCFDVWCLESCLFQKYGIKELLMVITVPFYQIKIHCLQEMLRTTINNMEIGRNSVAQLINNSSYESYQEKLYQRQRQKEQEESSDYRPVKSRDFETYHAFYLHDHTNNPYNIIRSRANPVQISSEYRNLESGSDCDEISPIMDGWVAKQKRAVKIDPSILTENLADFFEDVMNEDTVAEQVSQTVDSMEKPMGVSKEEVAVADNAPPATNALSIKPYPVPENVTVKKEEAEKPTISDDEMIDSSSYANEMLRFSGTAPVVSKQSMEEEMGFSK